MPILLDNNTVSTGIEPAISCVTGVLTATLRDLKMVTPTGLERVTAVKGRCLNRLTKEPFLSTR